MTAGSLSSFPHRRRRSGQIRPAWASAFVALVTCIWLGWWAFQPGRPSPSSEAAVDVIPSVDVSHHEDASTKNSAAIEPDAPASQQAALPSNVSTESKLISTGEFPGGIKVVYRLPETDSEIQDAHERNAHDACETLPPGERIERPGFFAYLTAAEEDELGDENSVRSARQHLFSVGIDFLEEDRRDLPFLSGGEITRFFQGRYVMLQARVRKSAGSQTPYLHHKTLGGMTTYQGPGIAEAVTSGVEESFRHYRSLGLVLKPDEAVVPENLRTLAIIHKSERLALTAESTDDLTYHFEYVFVQALDIGSEQLELHTFVTSENRTRLHHLQFAAQPSQPDDCSVTTLICFTEYTQMGLRPKTSATRSMVYQDRATYALATLDRHAQQQGWTGGALANISDTLDAIIAGEVAEEGGTE